MLFRLFLFSRGINSSSVYERELSTGLTNDQESTVLSLTFTDPTIYQENKSIQIVNASNAYGLGTRLATFISNIGGNVILVSTANDVSEHSKILYANGVSYTVKKLGNYLNFPIEASNETGVSDVIIIIGIDKIKKLNFNMFLTAIIIILAVSFLLSLGSLKSLDEKPKTTEVKKSLDKHRVIFQGHSSSK